MAENQASYSEMRKAQSFFGEAIEFCMKGDVDKLHSLVKEFVTANPQYKVADIFQNFQTEGKTFLHIATSSGHENIFNFIFKFMNSREFINSPDKNGFTPLINATISEKYPIVQTLLNNGANVNTQNSDGAAAIHFAAADGPISILQILLDHNANISLMSKAGNALHWAAGKGRVEAINILIQRNSNVDIDALSPSGLPAVLMAAVSKSDKVVKLLVDAGANVGFIISGNLTLLHICSENGLKNSVQSILKSPSGVKCCGVLTNEGNSPLDLAAMSEHRDIIELLLPFYESYSEVIASEGLEATIESILATGAEKLKQWHETHASTPASQQTATVSSQPTPSTSDIEHDQTITDLFNSLVSPKSPEDEQLSEASKRKGNEAFVAKQYDTAVTFYSEAIKYNNRNETLWSNRSACYILLKQYSEALRDAEICVKLNPTWPKGRYRLANARFHLGRYEDAAVAAFEGCKLDNSNKELKELMQKAVAKGREEYTAAQQQAATNSSSK